MVTDRDIYFFDLLGYVIIRGALSPAEVKACNDTIDAIPPLKPGEWYGALHCHTYGTKDGNNYQQIYEAGDAFEKLIDHPSWIEHIKTFIGGMNTFDAHHGQLFIDECFVNFREPGEAIGMHSGGDSCTKRNQYRVHNKQFMNGQVNSLVALRDIGPGDGGTMIIPASHKQHFQHPDMAKVSMKPGGASGDGCEGAIEVFLKAGDALIFTDTMCHGSAKRMNPGQRRIVVHRYGPSWGFFRHGYRPSRELLERLTPARRAIVWPHEPLVRTPNKKPGFDEIEPGYHGKKSWSGVGG
ncbi:MAG: phytanoyl-CoA dioxygenase family protein [Planctomycetota bacterium]|nr:phytanoyl-CoA dioxygenase family protein [Planctomycetota bacterium]